ncbi:MAG TPA: superoxide dismutase [Ni] [Phycisphaerales bacterium]|nr:superoxide dismutase [Ni] [Phycisphaerales bacterium]
MKHLILSPLALLTAASVAIAGPALLLPAASGHCQIPCGIYDDAARIDAMQEHATSIRKAMGQVGTLHRAGTLESFNQSVRWTMEKDRSATEIQEIASSYFLTQRVKAADPESPQYAQYVAELQGFHAVLVAAMKCKQQVNTKRVDELDAAIANIAQWYKE